MTSNKEKFLSICKDKLWRDGSEKLIAWLENTDFFTAPASTRFHGNHEGGLCEHSINVYEQLLKLFEIYGDENTPKETLAIVALFHDICKINFYKKGSRNVKDENERWVKKEVWEIDDQLPLGHGEKSCILLQRYIELTKEELLAIRWHMGGFDLAVKGGEQGISKAQDISKLVTLLSAADMLSSNLLETTTA
jgi:HD superfamily phosphohydrolase YqeK